MALLLGVAGLGGCTLVGLNTTRRGDGLAADVRRSDTQVVLTDPSYASLLHELAIDGVRVVDVTGPGWHDLLAAIPDGPLPSYDVSPDSLMMLIFTSGTSGDPRAVRITHEKVAFPGTMLADRLGLGRRTSATCRCRCSTRTR